jgi:hypothetical protein
MYGTSVVLPNLRIYEKLFESWFFSKSTMVVKKYSKTQIALLQFFYFPSVLQFLTSVLRFLLATYQGSIGLVTVKMIFFFHFL